MLEGRIFFRCAHIDIGSADSSVVFRGGQSVLKLQVFERGRKRAAAPAFFLRWMVMVVAVVRAGPVMGRKSRRTQEVRESEKIRMYRIVCLLLAPLALGFRPFSFFFLLQLSCLDSAPYAHFSSSLQRCWRRKSHLAGACAARRGCRRSRLGQRRWLCDRRLGNSRSRARASARATSRRR
jgi:hypothetical protein